MNLLRVQLFASTTVDLPAPRVWDYMRDPHHMAEYDRSVARVEMTSPKPYGVGTTFETISPVRRSGRTTRTSYRVCEIVEGERAASELVGSRVFRRAVWEVRVPPAEDGTAVAVAVDFAVRPLFFFVAVVLRLAQRNLLATDMRVLHDALEAAL